MQDEGNLRLQMLNLPEKPDNYKFVQFRKRDENYLRFSSKLDDWDDEYHYMIVERFANEIGEEVRREKSNRKTLVHFMEGSEYIGVGAGMSRLDIESKKILFGGRSYGYQVGVDKESIDKVMSGIEELSFEIR